MRIMDKIKSGIRSFLNIQEANDHTVLIRELLSFEGNVAKNKIWYRGDSYELDQFYRSIDRGSDGIKFWGANQTSGREMRKIHTGLPSIIVDRISDIVMNDMNQIEFKNEPDKELWEKIVKDNNFKEVLKSAVTDTLVMGDGAFKISLDPKVSEYPIIEFFEADNVEYVLNRGRIKEIIFKSEYKANGNVYVLNEVYGYGYIYYKLYKDGKEVELRNVPDLKDLQPVSFNESFIMAHPLKFYKSSKWKNRGQSVFDKKTDDFDALDEVWSQWMDALRKGRSKEYIPEELLPRNPDTGEIIKPNGFDNSYITKGDDMKENGQNKIEVVQPGIPHESYLASYVTALDLCLQGLISPSTLGIDVKKLDNADAQREKEKTTLYTRDNVIDVLQEQLPEFINKVFKTMAARDNKQINETESTVSFGEYANPSFESQIETISKGKQGGIMSIEASVEELYGDTKDEEWKQAEIARLKAEQGIAEVAEPAVNMEGVNLGSSESISTLNGAQITSLMNVIKMVKEKSISRSEAISIIVSTLGISKENAESFIEEGVVNEGNGNEPGLPNDQKSGAEPA